jgi:hypothetical protein
MTANHLRAIQASWERRRQNGTDKKPKAEKKTPPREVGWLPEIEK